MRETDTGVDHEQVGSGRREKRHRNTGNRQQSQIHAGVYRQVDEIHRPDADEEIGREVVFGFVAEMKKARQEQKKHDEDEDHADQAHFLTDDRENKVGGGCGEKA